MSRVLYGCVVVLTMLVGLGEDPLHPVQDMVMVWISVVGVGLSEFWSEVTVQEAMLGHKAYWPEVSRALRHSFWTLAAALVPTVTFSMSATGQLSVATGYKLACWAVVAFIFVAAARTRWLSGASFIRSTVTGLVASALGYGISQLRAFVH
jgi:hypothetical protein